MAVIGLKRKHSHRNKAKKQQHPEILLKMSLTNTHTHTPKYVWVGKFPWPHRNCTICTGCDNIRILNATLLHLRLQVTRAIFIHSQQQTHSKIKEKTNRVQHLQLAEFHMISLKWLCEKSRNAWNCVDLFVGSEFSKCVCVCVRLCVVDFNVKNANQWNCRPQHCRPRLLLLLLVLLQRPLF